MNPAGYIVADPYGCYALGLITRDNALWRDIPEGGILLDCGRTATLFRARRSALAAIVRTLAYMERRPLHRSRGHGQPDNYVIVRLQDAPRP